MVETKSKSKEFFIATITVELSQRTFLEFIRTGGSSNYLPEFQRRLTVFQNRLEGLDDVGIRLSDTPSFFEDDRIVLNNFRVTTLTYSEGSVVAKVQIACAVLFGAPFAVIQTLAAYPDAKDGFQVLRDDLIAIAKEVFDDIPYQAPPRNDQDPSSVSYYFLRPERAEKNLRDLAEKERQKSLGLDDEEEDGPIQQTIQN